MSLRARLWSWRRAALVTGLSLVAAFAGYQSELKAGATVTKFTLRNAQYFEADWISNPLGSPNGSDATAWAENGVNGPGKPQPFALAAANVDVWTANPDGSSDYLNVFAMSNSVDPSVVSAQVKGNGATGSTNFTIPGTLTTNNTNTTPVMVSVQASGSSPVVETTHNRQTLRDRVSGTKMFSSSNMQNGDPFQSTGSGSITVTDPMGNLFPAVSFANVATDWSWIEDISNGDMTIMQ
jgi:hypothetical protein